MPFGSPTDEVVQPATFGHPDDEVIAPAQGQTFGHPEDEVVAAPSTKGYTTGSQPLVQQTPSFSSRLADTAGKVVDALTLNPLIAKIPIGNKTVGEYADMPIPGMEKYLPAINPLLKQAAQATPLTQGLEQGAENATKFLYTPKGIGLMAAGPLGVGPRSLSALYGLQAAANAPQQAGQLVEAAKGGNPSQIGQSLAENIANAIMGAMSFYHAAQPARPSGTPPVLDAEIVNEPKALLPENASVGNLGTPPVNDLNIPGNGQPIRFGTVPIADPARLLPEQSILADRTVGEPPVNVLPPTENPVAPPDFVTPREQLTQLGPRVIQQGPMIVPPARQLGPPIESPPNASPIRSDEGLPPQETQEERPAKILQGGSGELRGGDLQRPQTTGGNPNGAELRAEETGGALTKPKILDTGNGIKAKITVGDYGADVRYENSNGEGIGILTARPYEGGKMVVEMHELQPEARGIGVGGKVVEELGKKYGEIVSDEHPSADAQAMWERIGAKRERVVLGEHESIRYVYRPKETNARGPIEPPPSKNVEDRGSIGGNLSTFGFADPAMWKQAKRTFEEWVKGDKNEPRPPGYSPYFKATPQQRAADILGPGPSRPINDVEIGQGRQPGQPKPSTYGLQNTAATLRNVVNKADKAILVNDAITDLMDNSHAKFNGPLMQHIMWPIDDNYQVEYQLREKYLQPLRQIIKDEKLTPMNGERFATAMISRQEGGRPKLIASGVTDSSIRSINASLTEGEKRVIRYVNKANDEVLDLLRPVAAKFGVELNKVDNYLSWMRDWKKYDAPPKEVNLPDLNRTSTVDDVRQWFTDAYPRRGTKTADSFTKERTNALTPIKLNGFEIFDRHIRDAMHYVAMAEHLRDVGEIVRDPRFAEKYGKMGQDLMLDHLNTVARQGRSGNSIPILDALRKRASLGILGYRVASQIIHLVNTPLGMFRAGPINWIKGLQEAHTAEGQAWLKANGAETFERGGGEPGIVELAKGNERGITPNPIRRAGEAVVAHAFDVPRFIDQKIAQATLIGTYQKLLEQKGLDSSKWASMPVDKEALAQARVYARRAVASPLYKDTANVLSKGSVSKLFFQFQNTFMDQWSNIRHDLPEYLKHDPKQAAGLAVALFTMLAMESFIKINVKKAEQRVMGYIAKNKEDFTHKMAEEALKRFPVVGQIMNIIGHGGSGIPVADLIREALSGGADIIKAGQEGDKKKLKLAKVREATRIGELAGFPGANEIGTLAENRLRATDFPSHEQRIAKIVQDKFKTDKPTLQQRLEAEKILQKTKEPLSRAEDVSAGQANLKNAQNRGADVQKALPKDMQDFLDKIGKRIPGHDNRIKINGTELTFTSDELKRYNEILTEKYQKNLGVLQRQWANKVPNGVLKDNLFSHYTEMSKKQADIAMRAELQKRKP